MLQRHFLALFCLSLAPIAVPSINFAQTEALENAVESASSEKAASFRHVIALLEEEIALLEADLAKLSAERDAEARALDEARSEAKSFQARVTDLQESEEDATARLGDLEDQQAQLEVEIKAARAAMPDTDMLGETQAELSAMQVDRDVLAAEIAELQQARQSLQAELIRRLDEHDDDLMTRQQELDRATARLTEVRTESEAAQLELADLASRRDAAQSELAQAEQALDATNTEITEAEAERAALSEGQAAAAEASRNKAAMAESQTDLDALRAEIKAETTGLDDARKARGDLEQQVSTLRTELSTLEDSVEAIRAEQQSALTDLQAELAEAVAALTEAKTEEAERRDAVKALVAETDALTAQSASARADLSDLDGLRTDLAAEVERLEQDRAARAEELAALQVQIEEADAKLAAEPEPTLSAIPAPVGEQNQRSPEMVAAVLQSAPGLPPLDSAEMRRLTELLIDGACPTNALRDTFGTINRQSLVALVRVLGTC